MPTLCVWDRQVSGSILGRFRFRFFEPHSKKHSKGAKIPQFHSKYFKFKMCIGLVLNIVVYLGTIIAHYCFEWSKL